MFGQRLKLYVTLFKERYITITTNIKNNDNDTTIITNDNNNHNVDQNSNYYVLIKKDEFVMESIVLLEKEIILLKQNEELKKQIELIKEHYDTLDMQFKNAMNFLQELENYIEEKYISNRQLSLSSMIGVSHFSKKAITESLSHFKKIFQPNNNNNNNEKMEDNKN